MRKAVGKRKVKDWALFTASVDYSVLKAFRRACRERGHTATWVIENAMRYYIDHPRANGWSDYEREGGEKSKSVSES